MSKFYFDLTLFDNTQTTSTGTLTAEMRTFYDATLIDLAGPRLVHDQFGQKRPIPANNGKVIDFRRFESLAKALTPLVEGVTPKGDSLEVTNFQSTVQQYGKYVEVSDMLDLTAVDNIIVEATKLIADQAGRTLDTVSREVLNTGTNVIYCGGVTSRSALAATNKLTVEEVFKAVRALKAQNAPTIDGGYVAIIHPDVAYDLMRDKEWINVSTYAKDGSQIFEGEIGKIAGVRFVETTEAKIWEKASSDTRSVYSTLFVGNNAYGVTEITGGGLKHIVKNLGSGGSSDPLDQRATIGWKAVKTAEILVQQYMVRVESCSTFSSAAN